MVYYITEYRSPPISASRLPSYCKIIDFLCGEMFPAQSSAMKPMCYLIYFQVALFTFFSIISSLLGLASVSYYANTGAASWDVYWSSLYYLIISSATCLFAIVQVIIGVVAGIYSCLTCGGDTQSEQVGPDWVMSWLALRVLIFFFFLSKPSWNSN